MTPQSVAPAQMDDAFWDACAEGVLLVQQCTVCGTCQYPPMPRCGHCRGAVAYVESSGRGEVYSYSTVHRPQDASFTAPYTVAIVAMAEGWTFLGLLVDVDPAGKDIVGLPVQLVFRTYGGRLLPCFTPRRSGASS